MLLYSNRKEREKGATTNRVSTYGGMGRFVIHVDECSLYVGKDLNRILELLADVMRFPQRCACVHDNVDLDEVVWTALVYGIP